MIKPKSIANLFMSSPREAKVTVFLNVMFLKVSQRKASIMILSEIFGCKCFMLAMMGAAAAESSRIERQSRRFEERIFFKEEAALALNS
jgi:hypothetical protein